MSETVGAALRAAREERRLTLAQVAESTKVRVHYLQALESDDISAMPSAAQARGFLRLYVAFLGLDLESLIPPPADIQPESPAEAEAAAQELAGAEPKPGLPRFLTDLKAGITSRRPAKSSADAAPSSAVGEGEGNPPSAPSQTAELQTPPDDKKKLSR